MKNCSCIEVQTKFLNFINYSYIIVDNITRSAAIIDPLWELEKLVTKINKLNLKLKSVLLTHSHKDYVNLVNTLIDLYNVEVYISKKEAEFYKFNSKNLNLICDNDIIKLGHSKIKGLLTPGHTIGSMCFLVDDTYLFTGDTLFTEGCGRCDYYGGSPEMMFESISRLKYEIHDNIKIYPGHSFGMDRGITMKEMYKYNLYLNIDSKDIFVKFRTRGTPNIEFK
ncbi:MBL fold metallo-hydrolase [uncultured Clostridium sp.]|uniref:MBL fold metallo-hydrolase n=1 Tax=uncultured Clostridium sp. TaxID=59620 RepID=UPI0025D0CF9C|nr:MBL fold metallo-hydrolase [uncultured Clostridium sp.]